MTNNDDVVFTVIGDWIKAIRINHYSSQQIIMLTSLCTYSTNKSY